MGIAATQWRVQPGLQRHSMHLNRRHLLRTGFRVGREFVDLSSGTHRCTTRIIQIQMWYGLSRAGSHCSGGPDPSSRLRAKVGVLSALKERGVWLVDASVAALYRPGQPKLTSRERGTVLQTSWDAYTRAVVEAAEPEAVLCIGVGVVRSLRTQLDRMKVHWAGVPQPQAHLSRAEHEAIHAIFTAVCSDPRQIRYVPAVA